jgi:hypothetical protein
MRATRVRDNNAHVQRRAAYNVRPQLHSAAGIESRHVGERLTQRTTREHAPHHGARRWPASASAPQTEPRGSPLNARQPLNNVSFPHGLGLTMGATRAMLARGGRHAGVGAIQSARCTARTAGYLAPPRRCAARVARLALPGPSLSLSRRRPAGRHRVLRSRAAPRSSRASASGQEPAHSRSAKERCGRPAGATSR